MKGVIKMISFDNYEFISEYKNKTLSTVISVLPNNYPKTEISNEVLLNFSGGLSC